MEDYEKAFELAKENTKRFLQNIKDIDKKIHNIIGITGIILSALAGFSLLSPTLLTETKLLSYTIGIGLIFISLIISIINYTFSYSEITLFRINPKKLNELKNVDFKELIEVYMGADEGFIKRNRKKWRIMKVSIFFLTTGLLLVVLASLYSLIT